MRRRACWCPAGNTVKNDRSADRLRDGHARPVREHLYAGLDYQGRLVRFLENHDEPRAAATFTREMHQAAAVITFLSPGLRFFHQGQFEGHHARISPHLVRAPIERTDDTLREFYDRLLSVLRRDTPREGSWQLLECAAAWKDNGTWDGFLAFAWEDRWGERLLAVVNYAGTQAQCYVRLPFRNLADRQVHLSDLMRPASYDRDGNDVLSRGLYLDLLPWGYHVFEITGS